MSLCQIAFAEHLNNMVKMDSFKEKCIGLKKIDWRDGLKDWFRRTWTLQVEPCRSYYRELFVNPIPLVPPTKVKAVTIPTFITVPLKHFGQGVNEFVQALLKDSPITLQIQVFLIFGFAIAVCMYGRIKNHGHNAVCCRRRRRRRRRKRGHRVENAVENIGNVDRAYVNDATDAELADRRPQAEDLESLSATGSESQGETDSDEQQDNQEELAAGGDAAATTPQSNPKPLQSSQAKQKPLKENKNLLHEEFFSPK
ncbi:chloride channel CLIC-like protein 1 [Genypterus blacodes]|uniref:chloride channel CLIC-like protein 1 n=1 Tax=Genypterus blacodes TaxID=154954 RepID=UPI003F76E3F6